MNNKTDIYWTARNNSTFMTGVRVSFSMSDAVRDARKFLRDELYNEGVISYYATRDTKDMPIRVDELSIHTGYKMVIKVRVGHELVTK